MKSGFVELFLLLCFLLFLFACLPDDSDSENEESHQVTRLKKTESNPVRLNMNPKRALDENEILPPDSVHVPRKELKLRKDSARLNPETIQIRKLEPLQDFEEFPLNRFGPQEKDHSLQDGVMPFLHPQKNRRMAELPLFGKAECPDCDIDGICYEEGETNPENICQICDVSESTTEWTDNDEAPCDDELWCNGIDFCLGGACSEHENPPCPNDGLWCNGAEVCHEDNDTCTHEDPPECPDDGLWCNGGESCNEDVDACVHQYAEGERCPDDKAWCNGEEYCDEETDACSRRNVPDCTEDGDWCNGQTQCDENQDECIVVDVPDCSDDGNWCNGEESCDEETDQCISSGNPCDEDEVCNESEDECREKEEEEESENPGADIQEDSFKTDEREGGCCGCGC